MKDIPISEYFRLDLGGEFRISREWPIESEGQGFWSTRSILHAHIRGPYGYRIFSQLKYSDVEGKTRRPSSLDNDYGDVQQIFIDKTYATTGEEKIAMRIGRQEATFGSARFTSVREGPNSRLTYDGIRLGLTSSGEMKIDLFVSRPTLILRNDFDNEPDQDNLFAGFYGGTLYSQSSFKLDAYLFYFEQLQAEFLETLGTEERYSLGVRLMTNSDVYSSDTDVVLQLGSFNEEDILAYGAASTMSWKTSVQNLNATLLASFFTGDGANGSNKLSTFNALYPKGTYYGWSGLIGHTNLMALQPGLQYFLRDDLKLTTEYGFYWRQSLSDSVYRGNGNPISLAPEQGNYIGSQFNFSLTWMPNVLIQYSFEFSRFFADIETLQSLDSEFFAGRILFKF